ncbi:hypothetical protein QR680_017537 [Steinernema hermaphroditum]|uniref:Uncharacterized protein n=1 Tax=Steinernema hermaphroditum TaxID=289476 RepID=A0AA39LNU1_9BILA|nr:hypothetical protein QR680_017537 [Steinernema hermaphroditum]
MCFTRKPLFARAARGSRRRSSSTLTSAPPHELKTGLLCSTVSGNSLFASPMSAHTDGIAVFYSDVLKPEEDRRLRSDNMVLVHTYDVSQGVSLRYEK